MRFNEGPRKLTQAERSTVKRLQDDPIWYLEEVLGVDTLWDGQKRILESVRDNKRTAVRSCHGAGKSFIAARTVVWYLLTRPYSIVLTTAPTDRQVWSILWQEIRRARSHMKVPVKSEPLIKQWRVEDGWYALGLSTREPDSFQGYHAASGNVLVVIDEASGVPRTIWDAVDGSLSSTGARLLSIGNPLSRSGAFFSEFSRNDANKIRISCFDTPNFTKYGVKPQHLPTGEWKDMVKEPLPHPYLTTPSWAASMLEKLGSRNPLYMAKVLGEFPDDSDDTLISLSWVEDATERGKEKCMEVPDPEDIVLGVDVARYGGDETVIALRRGRRCRTYATWRGKNTMETVGRVVEALRATGASLIRVDDTGVGGGVTDRLEELGHPVEPVNGGESAIEPDKFLNRRAEMWWTAREMLGKHEIDILDDDDVLAAQLVAPHYGYTSKGLLKIESKEEMSRRLAKERGTDDSADGWSSPDRADAMLLTICPSKRYTGPLCW